MVITCRFKLLEIHVQVPSCYVPPKYLFTETRFWWHWGRMIKWRDDIFASEECSYVSLGLHDLPNEYRCVQHGVCTYTAPHTILGGVVACRIWSLHDEQLNCWNWIRLQSDELKKCFKKYYATGVYAAKIYGHFLRKTNVEKSISNQQIKARSALFSLSFIE